MQQDSEAFNLERALGILRRRVVLIGLCVVVVGGAAFGFSKRQTKEYTAAASLAFTTNELSQQIAGLPVSKANSATELLAEEASNVELVKSAGIAATVASAVGHGLTEEEVRTSVSVTGHGESGVVGVSVTSTSPVLAAEIANTYVNEFVKEQQSANRAYLKYALAIVHRQLAALSPQQRIGSDGLDLQERAQTLSLLSELKEGNVQVSGEAQTPSGPSSPRTSRNTVLGILVGLLIGISLAIVLERYDRRIRKPDELETIYGLPLLGMIPESAAFSRPARDDAGKRLFLPPADAEAFNLVRAHLRFVAVNRDPRIVAVVSAEPGDGKSTVARYLAEAATRLGSRVLLLEVDLRHPTVAQQLGVPSAPGLTDVLTGAMLMSEATQSIDVGGAVGEGRRVRALDVLTAGVLPPNPAELLESRAMGGVLEQAKSRYELVVIDTPPLTAVSDAFPLLTEVDGVLIVSWIGRGRRDAAERLQQVLVGSGAPLLGVVANGTRSGIPYGKAYFKESAMAPADEVTTDANSSEKLTPTIKA